MRNFDKLGKGKMNCFWGVRKTKVIKDQREECGAG